MALQYAGMADELFDVERRVPGPGDADGEVNTGETILLRLHVQPGAGRAAVAGRHGDALHVRVAPPPQDGRANEAAVALVAELLDVPRSRIDLVSGERSREKRVRVSGVDPVTVRTTLTDAIERAGSTGGRSRGGHSGR
ncbi:MAG: hypothetical protein JWO62_1247 [Acidimicrobiaceae bacterium]|nr:hypothetical protein [Acidimicrobiaceae bacterium]